MPGPATGASTRAGSSPATTSGSSPSTAVPNRPLASPAAAVQPPSHALLSKVYLSQAVVQNCLVHAFTTEKEEVMGVLLGHISVERGVCSAYQEQVQSASTAQRTHAGSSGTGTNANLSTVGTVGEGEGEGSSAIGSSGVSTSVAPAVTPRLESKVAHVYSSFVIQRSVRRSDRVEIAPERLISASEEAERLSTVTGLPMQVIGWYHSHPLITVYPSEVDLLSQKLNQQMESGWVGLIFSVFCSDAAGRNDCSIHCFQAGPDTSHVKVPFEVLLPAEMGMPPDAALFETTAKMFHVLQEEMVDAVEDVRQTTGGDAMAMGAAAGLQQVQMFTLERLIVEPAAKQIEWCSMPMLQAEVERLEKELAEKPSR